MACDWYRRLGLHEKGYRLLAPDRALPRRTSTADIEGRRLLWAARFLNLLGASEFAMGLLEQIEPVTFDDHRIIGSIYLANFDYEHARSHLSKARAMDPDPSRYVSRLSLINLADACSGAAARDEAISIARSVLNRSHEPLLQGIALTAIGEYLARDGQFRAAEVELARAYSYFPSGDLSPDFGLFLKWKGFVEGKLGDAASARTSFARALSILRQSHLRPEAWLDILRLQAQAQLLDEETLRRLKLYPGTVPHFAKQLQALAALPQEPSGTTDWWIDLERDEYRSPEGTFIGLPTEVRLIAFLWLAGPWGIPRVRLKALLWPNEVYSYLYLENRLQQLICRVRQRYRIQISLSENIARLTELGRIHVHAANSESAVQFPSFLDRHRQFTRRDLQEGAGLQPTHAWLMIQEWRKRGWVRAKKQGREYVYEVIRSSQPDKM